MEIFPELEYCKTGEWKIYITETGSREFRRSDPESAVGIRKLQDSYFNRLPNGNMFANEYHFEIQPGETKEIELVLREADLEDMLENISMPDFMLKTEDGTELKASDLTADGKHILMFLEEEKEPTEHILNEMMEQEEAFAGYAEQIIFVVRSKEALETPTLSKALAKLKNIQIYYDDFSEIINTLGRRMYVDPDKLPLIIVTNGSLNGIYATSGYNVGTGDMLLRLM